MFVSKKPIVNMYMCMCKPLDWLLILNFLSCTSPMIFSNEKLQIVWNLLQKCIVESTKINLSMHNDTCENKRKFKIEMCRYVQKFQPEFKCHKYGLNATSLFIPLNFSKLTCMKQSNLLFGDVTIARPPHVSSLCVLAWWPGVASHCLWLLLMSLQLGPQ